MRNDRAEKRISFLAMGMSLLLIARAQDSAMQAANPFSIAGYVEAYYSYDFNRPPTNNRPRFLYNFARHNEFTVNLAFLKAAYAAGRTRANLALGAGTYTNANYVAEPGVLKNLFEANVGYQVMRRQNLWFDIGILPSHIGFESAVGKDNWTLTRSLVAESTPYFESGAKLTYTTKNTRLLFAVLALNGWQRITRPEGHSLISWGTQLTYKPTGNTTLSYNTFVGSDKADSARRWRYHHNLTGVFQLSGKIGFIANLDYGLEQKAMNSRKKNKWYTPVVMVRITPNQLWAATARAEYFRDRNGVIIGTATANGFATVGTSLNIDYRPEPNIALRVEGRHLKSKDSVFEKQGRPTNRNTAVTFSAAVSF